MEIKTYFGNLFLYFGNTTTQKYLLSLIHETIIGRPAKNFAKASLYAKRKVSKLTKNNTYNNSNTSA